MGDGASRECGGDFARSVATHPIRNYKESKTWNRIFSVGGSKKRKEGVFIVSPFYPGRIRASNQDVVAESSSVDRCRIKRCSLNPIWAGLLKFCWGLTKYSLKECHYFVCDFRR